MAQPSPRLFILDADGDYNEITDIELELRVDEYVRGYTATFRGRTVDGLEVVYNKAFPDHGRRRD